MSLLGSGAHQMQGRWSGQVSNNGRRAFGRRACKNDRGCSAALAGVSPVRAAERFNKHAPAPAARAGPLPSVPPPLPPPPPPPPLLPPRLVQGRFGGGGQQGGAPTCQRCLQPGHWTYECKNEPAYQARPTRTQQLKNPKVRRGGGLSSGLAWLQPCGSCVLGAAALQAAACALPSLSPPSRRNLLLLVVPGPPLVVLPCAFGPHRLPA